MLLALERCGGSAQTAADSDSGRPSIKKLTHPPVTVFTPALECERKSTVSNIDEIDTFDTDLLKKRTSAGLLHVCLLLIISRWLKESWQEGSGRNGGLIREGLGEADGVTAQQPS